MIIFEKTPFEGKRPLHVLIVVVGNDNQAPLRNAKAFCQSICDFWTKHDDASLAHNMSLSSVQLLASDPVPDNKTVTVDVGKDSYTVERPSLTNVKKAIRKWCAMVSRDGAGIIHWVGHGRLRMQEGGDLQILFTDDEVTRVREGINWSITLKGIDNLTAGNPVFCFVDCCRMVGAEELADSYDHAFSGQGAVPRPDFKNAAIMYAGIMDTLAFWDNIRHSSGRAFDLGFEGGPMATRAVLRALEGIGADYTGRHDVRMIGIEEGARALVRRWMRETGSPIEERRINTVVKVDFAGATDLIKHASPPLSVLDVQFAGATDCTLISTSSGKSFKGIPVPETSPTHFEFMLPRDTYVASFRLADQSLVTRELADPVIQPCQTVEVA